MFLRTTSFLLAQLFKKKSSYCRPLGIVCICVVVVIVPQKTVTLAITYSFLHRFCSYLHTMFLRTTSFHFYMTLTFRWPWHWSVFHWKTLILAITAERWHLLSDALVQICSYQNQMSWYYYWNGCLFMSSLKSLEFICLNQISDTTQVSGTLSSGAGYSMSLCFSSSCLYLTG